MRKRGRKILVANDSQSLELSTGTEAENIVTWKLGIRAGKANGEERDLSSA